MRNCCKVPSALSAWHLTLIHNKMSLTVNPWPLARGPKTRLTMKFLRIVVVVLAAILVVLPKLMKAAASKTF